MPTINWIEKRQAEMEELRQQAAERECWNNQWKARAAVVLENEKRERDATLAARQRLLDYAGSPEGAREILQARIAAPLSNAAFDGKPPNEVCWMPAGRHTICAHAGDGGTWSGEVVCDEIGARNVQLSFKVSIATGQRVWIDLGHDDGEAAGWVTGFRWQPGVGIMCAVEWTPLGVQAIVNRVFYSFSPAFMIEKETGRVLRLIFGKAAGGLVNAPAFGAAMPALAAKAGDPALADAVFNSMSRSGILPVLCGRARDMILAGDDINDVVQFMQSAQRN